MVHTEPGRAGPDIEILFRRRTFSRSWLYRSARPRFHDRTILLQPRSPARITRCPAQTPQWLPTSTGLSHDDDDMQRLVAGLKIGQEICAPAMAPHVGGPCGRILPGRRRRTEGSSRQYSETLYHPVGTCGWAATTRPWSILSCACGASLASGCRRIGHAALIRGTPTRRTIMIAGEGCRPDDQHNFPEVRHPNPLIRRLHEVMALNRRNPTTPVMLCGS